MLLHAYAHKLILDRSRCVGDEWEREGKKEERRAAEVILAGGTIGSPRLLLRSGIGPADELPKVGSTWKSICQAWAGIFMITCSLR